MRIRTKTIRLIVWLAAASVATACSHSDSNSSNTASNQTHSGASSGTASHGSNIARPANTSDDYRIADIAVARLGGRNAPNPPVVTGVSVVGNYGLTVYEVGTSSEELLSIKEKGEWRPLGSDAYYPDGRGLLHFGIAPDLASKLIAGLVPAPSR